MQTIYIDVLIVLNIYVNYFLLRTTAKITGSPLGTLRCIFASFYGSLFSLLILAPELPFAVTLIIKLIAAVTVVITAFGIHGKSRLIKNTVSFFSANFIFAGAIYAVYSWLKPQFMHFSNSYFYIDFSLLLLVVSTAVLYLLVCIWRRFSDNSPESADCYKIIVRYREKIFTADGLADTGNALTDFFSGKPVIICGKNDFDSLNRINFRLIPYSTISESSVIPVFSPDETVIVNTLTGEKKPVDAVIGLGENNGRAIFNPKILKN
ncbi:MAG: sigma-E processing peptidase SpoIIGA [Ruminococcus flavefaciens]|nr:sigma-E processing peptidase SpoIIGA [Ruminococcus flavefaciens]MCM1230303.1 sigma-E processing peptidase SpoIIGA [Ruminococcus flavefaciens]